MYCQVEKENLDIGYTVPVKNQGEKYGWSI